MSQVDERPRAPCARRVLFRVGAAARRLLSAGHVPEPPFDRTIRGSFYVAIVSTNPDTLDGLQAYLSRAGVASRGTALLDAVGVTCARATAVVLFPDEYPENHVVAFVRELRATRPRLLVLLVTQEPRAFGAVAGDDGRSIPPIALRRPSFGWDILDTLRAHSVTWDQPSGGRSGS